MRLDFRFQNVQFRLMMTSNGADPVAKQVTCASCRRSFLVPEAIGDFWVLCPYCEKVNPRAKQDIQKAPERRGTFLGFFDLVLLVLGIFGGIFGAFFCILAIGNDGMTVTFPAIW